MSGRGGSKRGVLGGCLGFLIRYMEDRVILDVMDDVFFTLKKIPRKFCVDIFIKSVSVMGGTWRMFRVSEWRLSGQGHP